ncbi:SLOG family protein (plasmid) [Nostoc sp. UHCC 0302]|uniref:SLOG family protein n=1 Tax=Nostoc sp. UHCC 0302 TaxID=3134896 RepID=UPI00311CA3FC
MTKIIAGTGHRPEKLGGHNEEVFIRLIALCKVSLQKMQATEVISGMALGFDQAHEEAAIELQIPLIAAVPFKGQDDKWQPQDKERYEHILFQTSSIIYVDLLEEYSASSSGYSSEKMYKRNQYMVDHCDEVLALFNGAASGTGNCVNYAESLGKPIFNVWKSWVKYRGF